MIQDNSKYYTGKLIIVGGNNKGFILVKMMNSDFDIRKVNKYYIMALIF